MRLEIFRDCTDAMDGHRRFLLRRPGVSIRLDEYERFLTQYLRNLFLENCLILFDCDIKVLDSSKLFCSLTIRHLHGVSTGQASQYLPLSNSLMSLSR